MLWIEVGSEDFRGRLIIGISLLAQVRAPLLVIYFVARLFKNKKGLDNGEQGVAVATTNALLWLQLLQALKGSTWSTEFQQ